MKLALGLLAGVVGLIGFANPSEAGSRFSVSVGFGGGRCDDRVSARWSYRDDCRPVYRPVCPPPVRYCPPVTYCEPVYRYRTVTTYTAPVTVYTAPTVIYTEPAVVYSAPPPVVYEPRVVVRETVIVNNPIQYDAPAQRTLVVYDRYGSR